MKRLAFLGFPILCVPIVCAAQSAGTMLPSGGAIRLENTSRFGSLLQGGKIRLSLQDAIELAPENNLDLGLVRDPS